MIDVTFQTSYLWLISAKKAGSFGSLTQTCFVFAFLIVALKADDNAVDNSL